MSLYELNPIGWAALLGVLLHVVGRWWLDARGQGLGKGESTGHTAQRGDDSPAHAGADGRCGKQEARDE